MHTKVPARLLAIIVSSLMLAACGGGGGGGGTTPPPDGGTAPPTGEQNPPPDESNHAPEVGVLFSDTVTEFDVVLLDGTATDEDGDGLEFEWKQKTGPLVELDAEALQRPALEFSAPETSQPSDMSWELRVSDGHNDPVVHEVSFRIVPGERGVVLFSRGPANDDADIHRRVDGDSFPTHLTDYQLPLSAAPSGEPNVTASPDGKRLAFVLQSDGTRIAIRDVASGTQLILPGEPTPYGRPDLLRWSPDGTQLAFAGTVSRNGIAKHVVFVARVPDTLEDFDPSIHLHMVSGEPPQGSQNLKALEWAPDSASLAAIGLFCAAFGTEVVVMPVAARTGTGVCNEPGGLRPVGPFSGSEGVFFSEAKPPLRFSPDGNQLAFAVSLVTPAPDFITKPVVVVSPVDAETLADPDADLDTAWRSVSGSDLDNDLLLKDLLEWSPNGTQLAFAFFAPAQISPLGCGDCGVYTVALDEDALTNPETDFAALRTKRSGSIALYTKTASAITPVEFRPVLSWSPDGSALAFSGFRAEDDTTHDSLGVFMVDSAQDDFTPLRISGSNFSAGDTDGNGLADDGGVASFAWSPDGRYVAMMAALEDVNFSHGYVTELWQVDMKAIRDGIAPDDARVQLGGVIPDGGRVIDFAWTLDHRKSTPKLVFVGDLREAGVFEFFGVTAGAQTGEREVLSGELANVPNVRLTGGYVFDLAGTSRLVQPPNPEQ